MLLRFGGRQTVDFPSPQVPFPLSPCCTQDFCQEPNWYWKTNLAVVYAKPCAWQLRFLIAIAVTFALFNGTFLRHEYHCEKSLNFNFSTPLGT